MVVVAICSPLLAFVPAASAGCGCDKAPPPPAAVRPNFASPGGTVTLFGDGLVAGRTYEVKFRQGGTKAFVEGRAVLRRDLADGVEKVQLVVPAPELPPGPTKIKVNGAKPSISVKSRDFTMLPKPLAIAEASGETLAMCYRAAVGKDGTVYIPLDIGDVAARMLFNGIAYDYPLVFGPEDVLIYNTQGFLMQELGPDEADIYSITDAGSPDSVALTYDRHEFETYRAEHEEDASLASDAADSDWHVSGTPHIDHDHLVLAVSARLEKGGKPDPGMTQPFDLSIVTYVPDGPAASSPQVVQWSDCSDTSVPHDDDEDDD